MDKEVVISLSNVSKDFRLPHEKVSSVKSAFVHPFQAKKGRKTETQHALRDISFDIHKGEFFGIVGRNGSGKSTLLKIIANIYQPTQGAVGVKGKLVPFIELGVGFNPELTGRDNVYLNGALMGFSPEEITAMYDDIVSFAELEQFMDQKLKNYSSGMQVRLAFSMATRSNADILLIDEVLAVGDADFQRKCFNYFKQLKRDKKTVVFVSHDMDAVKEYCDRAILIEDSRLEQEGDPNEIAAEYRHMFNESNTKTQPDPREQGLKRWGDGTVQYGDVTTTPTLVKTDEDITVSLKLRVIDDVEKPIFGFSIKNAAGDYLLGTNTKIKGIKVGNIKSGDEYTITWTVPNIFPDGHYYVNASVEHADGLTECDWLEEASKFTVRKDEMTPYPVQPPLRVTITKS